MLYNQPVTSCATLTGDSVRNPEGEDLGTIEDIMIDTRSGQVVYYVLSFGGFLGLGDKLFAIPPQAIGVDTEEECLILNLDKDQLEDAPGFDKDSWPLTTDEAFHNKLYGYYGYEYPKAA